METTPPFLGQCMPCSKNWDTLIEQSHTLIEQSWLNYIITIQKYDQKASKSSGNVASCYRRALPLQIWCSSDKRSRIYECVKIVTLLFLLIYSLPFAHTPFSWAARHTTMCLDCELLIAVIAVCTYRLYRVHTCMQLWNVHNRILMLLIKLICIITVYKLCKC